MINQNFIKKIINCKLFILILLNAIGFYAQQEPLNYNNPILPGYYPDPSIIRVGEDYYMVNSSFEWFPGMPIHHSKDLINWELIGYGLSRPEQIPLPKGLGDSKGIYAVTIRHHKDTFYLITTCVNCEGNFYITAKNPAGPWSDPVWLGSRGIDPSLFWDDDGKVYYTGHGNISDINDWPQKNGAWMQELDLEKGKLVGKKQQLTHGHASNARWTEGPHLYKIGGKYMLLVAEGGTGFFHAVTVFHSDKLWGPYIPNHANPVLTHRNLGYKYPIHSVGHADLVETQNGEWWAVMLGKRKKEGYSMLARETFLTPVVFEKQETFLTPVFNPGIGHLLTSQKRPNLPWTPVKSIPSRDEFSDDILALPWNFLRSPNSKWYHLKNDKVCIQLRPEVLDSLVNPSYIGKRIQHHQFEALTNFQFSSKKENEHAGLVIYRNSQNHIQLIKQKDELVLIATEKGIRKEIKRTPFKNKTVFLKVEADNIKATFSYGNSNNEYSILAKDVDIKMISDEISGGFNGPYVGMYATSNGEKSKKIAEFDWFEYNSK
jgi:alpha-N-arabinofuranosidase